MLDAKGFAIELLLFRFILQMTSSRQANIQNRGQIIHLEREWNFERMRTILAMMEQGN